MDRYCNLNSSRVTIITVWLRLSINEMLLMILTTVPMHASPALRLRLAVETFVDRFDPVPKRSPRSALQVRLAADIGGQDQVRRSRTERRQLAVAQLPRQSGLGDRVGAGRTATQMGIRHGLRR